MKKLIKKILREAFPFGGEKAPEENYDTPMSRSSEYYPDLDEYYIDDPYYSDFDDPEFWDILDDLDSYDDEGDDNKNDFPYGGHRAPEL